MSDKYSDNDYQMWLRMNAFVRHMRDAQMRMELEAELDRLDEIDMIVDCMDEYPIVDELLRGIIK